MNNKLSIPGAIIVAGVVVAVAVLLSGHPGSINKSSDSDAKPGVLAAKPPAITMKDVGADDHILGRADSKVFIVEYADLECPYCKQYEPVLNKIIKDYDPSSGKVAWVFRHFPIHSKAPYEAEASECAAEQGGNEAFFKYVDQIYTISKTDNNLDPKLLTKTASDIGLDKTVFQSCLDSGKFKSKVEASYTEAVTAGARGTPYTVLVTKDGKYPLTDQNGQVLGAVSYEDLKSVVDNLLK